MSKFSKRCATLLGFKLFCRTVLFAFFDFIWFVYAKRHHPLFLLMFQMPWLFSLVLNYVALNNLY